MSPDIASNFAQIKDRAQSRWHDVFEGDIPIIMVGTATCGRAAGAIEVLNAIKEQLGEEHQNIPVLEVGCMGHCYAEPLVTIVKPGGEYPPILYGYVTPEIA
ncbi:MAG: (2Fe-2S) ferredoxin domain-containing protein, partial [Chloroflexi bacterium]|nr:(2Fe-2S) ferredoxin domain-containing protein [Chloroflexota bacterium]